MADFCKQCSEALFGEDHMDLAGITKAAEQLKGLYVYVCCEQCGYIQVDVYGRCVTIGCLESHNGDSDEEKSG